MIRLKQKITGLILKQEKRIVSPAIWRGIASELNPEDDTQVG